MENKVLQANLDAIAKYDKFLAEQIKNVNTSSLKLSLSKTQKDEYNLELNGSALHNTLGAVDEAKKITSTISNINDKNGICIIFGLGLGYLVDEIVQKARGSVIIYEPNLGLLKGVLEIVELYEILSRKNVFLCQSESKLQHHIENLSDNDTKISITFLSSYRNIYASYLPNLAQFVQYSQGEPQTYKNTLNKFAAVCCWHSLYSIKNIINSFHISQIKNKFKGAAALVVSAGPSLGKNIDMIKKNRDKFVIFAVAPALKLLLNHDIKPDFVCLIEAMDTSGQLKDLDLRDIDFIVEPYTKPYIWSKETKNKFVFISKNNFLNDWLARTLGIDNSELESIGTVSYCALSSAVLAGCTKIILLGQDLAYADGRCYAKGSAYEDLECVFNEKEKKFEIAAKDFEKYAKSLLGKRINDPQEIERAKNYIKHLNNSLMTVKGQDNNLLPTQNGYALFIKHFEEFAKKIKLKNSDIKLINSSKGGAQIEGFENKDFITVCETLSPCHFVNLDTENLQKTFDVQNLKICLKKEQEQITNFLKLIQTLIKTLDDYDKELKLRKTVTKNAQKAICKFEKDFNIFKDNFSKSEIVFYTIVRNVNFIEQFIKNSKETMFAHNTKHHLDRMQTKLSDTFKLIQRILSDI